MHCYFGRSIITWAKIQFSGPNSNTSTHQKLKLVARQNRRLRELLRLDYAPEMSPKDFCLLNVAQITELINGRKQEEQQNNETAPEGKSYFNHYHHDIMIIIIRYNLFDI